MKKLIVALLLVLVLSLLIACGETVTTTGDVEETTTAAPITEETNTPVLVHGESLSTENYVAIQNAYKFDSSMSLSGYDLTCASTSLQQEISKKYAGYTNVTYIVTDADGKETTYDSTVMAMTALKKIAAFCGVKAELDQAAKKAVFKITPLNDEIVVIPSWTSLSCKAGYYVMFDFTTNINSTFMVTVTTKAGGSRTTAIYEQNNIRTNAVAGKSGQYTGVAKCTIPYAEGKTYYINICQNTSPYTTFISIPVTITAPKYDLPFQFIFSGDWDLIENRSYIDNLYEVLYNSYPRAYKRWAYTGTEALVLQVVAEVDSEHIAYNAGTKVAVQVAYANSAPADVGLFGHEFTHAIQSGYKIEYSGGWFTEAMADYGRFRFFHWGYDGSYAKTHVPTNPAIHDFHSSESGNNWYGYAQHNLFMTYLDWMWPTTDKNNDGEVTPDEFGLIDHIVYEAKMYKGSPVNDNPHTVGSTFNNWVKDITGIDTMDLVREQYVEDLLDGTYDFKGFRDFKDNFLIQNCYDIPDLTMPMIENVTPTAKTNAMLAAAVTTGDNLCKGAMIVMASAKCSNHIYSPYKMIDGDLSTRYQGLAPKSLQKIMNIDNEIVIDLGEIKTFDTYTFSFYGTTSATYAKSWEIFVSTDAKSYTAIDYQSGNDKAEVSVSFDEVSARYVRIFLYESDASSGNTRINEFMLFDLNK